MQCAQCLSRLPTVRAHAAHVLVLHADAQPLQPLPDDLAVLRRAFVQFRDMPQGVRDILWWFLHESPSPDRFDKRILRNPLIEFRDGMPRSSAAMGECIRTKVPYVPLKTDWILPYVHPTTGRATNVYVPYADFAAQTQLLFLNRFTAWLICSEAARHLEFPRAWNWVASPRWSCLVEAHPHLGKKFGTSRSGAPVNRGRNGPWLLYFDGTQAYRQSHDTILYNVYATRADYPSWFRNMDAAWIWVAVFPAAVVKSLGLSTMLRDLAARLFPGGSSEVRALCRFATQ